MSYTNFIPQNIAPSGVRRIGIYDGNGNRVGFIPLGSLTPPNPAQKLYTVGVLSDVHLSYTTGESDFINALNYLTGEANANMICIAGDLSDTGTDTMLSRYKELVEIHAPDTPIYVSAGNHDAYDADKNPREEAEVSASMLKWTGNPLYYSFEYGNDVFIFVGICKDNFSVAELQWLYETLERYRNKRCFLFQHTYVSESSGEVFGLYPPYILNNARVNVFKSLLRHYHNVIWFHGHSHTKLHGQEFGDMANYDKVFGCHSVHVPSIAVPRTDADGDSKFQTEFQDSEGYVVDVYENGIHLRGRDFVKGEFLPIASYWLDTTLQTIPAGTYTDSTGTIKP
jgi:DNA repair exonuclease SbcCD nuclease subunit